MTEEQKQPYFDKFHQAKANLAENWPGFKETRQSSKRKGLVAKVNA
jgi:hypothetical protein